MKLRTSWRTLFLAPLALPFVSLLAPSPTAFAAPAAPAKGHITTPSGRIVYQMTSTGGAGRSGTIDMTWSNHGALFRQDMQLNMGRAGARVEPTKIWIIFDGRAAYVGLPSGAMGPGKMALKMAPNAEQVKRFSGGNMMNTNGAQGKVVGKATLLGKPCEIRLMTSNTPQGTNQTKIWAWQGLPLRTEIQGKSKDGATTTTTIVATKLDTALKPAASTFKVPAGYTVQDMTALLGKMAGAMGKPQ